MIQHLKRLSISRLKIDILLIKHMFFFYRFKNYLKSTIKKIYRIRTLFPEVDGIKILHIIKLASISSFIILFVSLFPSPYLFFHEEKPFYGNFSWSSDDLVRLSQGDFADNGKGGLENYIPKLRLFEYCIEKGDTLWDISKKLNVDPDSIISCNSFSNVHSIHEGDRILIPNVKGIFVNVSEGDTIFGFSSKYNLPPDLIMELNDLRSNSLVPGMKIFLPGVRYSNMKRAYALGEAFDKPVRGRLTSGFGYRRDPFTRRRAFHTGIDIACRIGTRVHAAQGGKVIYAGIKHGYGRTIILEHKFGYKTIYGHLAHINISKGQWIKKGQTIGLTGNSGRSTGPHLHFEISLKNRIINPLTQTNMAVR